MTGVAVMLIGVSLISAGIKYVEDRVIDEEKEHYPRAFTDGEITYES